MSNYGLMFNHLADGILLELSSVGQDKTKELKYSRRVDFIYQIADECLHNMPTKSFFTEKHEFRPYDRFLCSYGG